MLYVGQRLYGYCGGYFGRGSYDDKRIEAFGVDWVVAREDSGEVVFARDDRGETGRVHQILAEYTEPPREGGL